MFSSALRPALKGFREEFDGEEVEAFAPMDDVSLGLMGVAANMIRAATFLWRGLDDTGIVTNTAKTVA